MSVVKPTRQTLTDLNDFITPSQACIKPVEEVKPQQQIENAASTQIGIDSAGVYYEESHQDSGRKKLQQSHEEVLKVVESNPSPLHPDHKSFVLSIAPQCLASLAASISPSATTQQILRRVEVFASSILGFSHVYDTTFARHIALLEHTREFFERRDSSTSSNLSDNKPGDTRLPMIASACPGWVCYVEKAHPEMIPFLSRTKSPQQVMVSCAFIRTADLIQGAFRANSIYHVTVMPCYDKKLEASRQDFYNDILSTRDVDCVLTTTELEILMRDKGWDISAPVPGEDETRMPNVENGILPELAQHPGSSSGSYLQSLIDSVSLSAKSPSVSTKAIRTTDYEEYTVTDEVDGRVLFRGAKCYGFRNLQNIVRKVGRDTGVSVGRGAAGRVATRGRRVVGATARKGSQAEEPRSYDYVEVMACPAGCVNGGGQLRGGARPQTTDGFDGVSESAAARDARWGDKQLVKDVEAIYWGGVWTPPPSPTGKQRAPNFVLADKLASEVLGDLCQPVSTFNRWSDDMDGEAESLRRTLFRTNFRPVESEVVGLAVQW
ncbi:nuclear prelamin A recognition factor-like protein [Rhizoctonia solani AG-1 IA]|uniref:Nuclear prelamin A recognition factor-like protein n=1 Tax=Thanatephorus cucumeris (strain AG1-IA) TaxID=983506 RepID=L8X1G5_THACA|nr:nuclear prelamin A recognition factor-like protein [Rhizoctonia solani AG-1 IA]